MKVKAAHPFGEFDINLAQGQGSPDVTTDMTLPAGTLYIPMAQGKKHWIQALLGENPYLPFNYFYDEMTWSDSLLRGFSGNGFLTQKLPAKATMTPIRIRASALSAVAATVYAFNTDSMAGLALVNDLLGRGLASPVPRWRSTRAACTSRAAPRSSTARRCSFDAEQGRGGA